MSVRRETSMEIYQIPNDIIDEILERLPVKSLIRFQTVSKPWGSLIRSKDFGERFISLQKTKDPKLLFVCDDLVDRSRNTLFLKTMALGTKSTSLENRQSLEFEEDFEGFLEISESCDGLVCIYSKKKAVYVMNPVTAMFQTLPLAEIQRLYIDKPDLDLVVEPVQDHDHPNLEEELVEVPSTFISFTRFGFGKDNVTGRYKLVWLYNNKRHDATSTSSLCKEKVRCEVLDLEEKKWRFVSTSSLDHHHILYNQRPAFANGSFYWLTGDDEDGTPTTETKLIVFDIHTELFQLIPTPLFITRDACGDKIGICNLDGRLCVSELKGDCKQDFWWRVNDNTTWEKIFSVDLRSTSIWFRGITSQPLTPLAISKDNNKVILSLTYQKSLVAFDLGRDTVYHLYYSGYYGLVVPYFPSLSLFL